MNWNKDGTEKGSFQKSNYEIDTIYRIAHNSINNLRKFADKINKL